MAHWVLTMVTLAFRKSRFSSCSALHLSLNVSSSIFSTLFSCCREANRFVSSSRRNWDISIPGLLDVDAVEDIGVAELLPGPSVSLSLSAITVSCETRQAGQATEQQRDWREPRVGDTLGNTN